MLKIKKDSALRFNFSTGVDDALVTDKQLYVRNPSGAETIVEETEIVLEDSVTGEYYVDFATGFFSTAGQWKLWSYITTSSGSYSGETITLIVESTGEGIVSREFVKEWIGITDTSLDTQIDKLIPLVERTYLDVRNCPFKTDVEGNILYPEGSDITAAEMIGYKLQTSYGKKLSRDVQSEKVGSYSVSYGDRLIKGFPVSIMSEIKTYVRGA